MRPVRLDMDGFASFREPTTIDFTDADYFVLIGPTGSGKSTVIDALTFALYGTVPRWSDRRAVRYGLAPTAGRGAVRLIFDADGRRYAVARELRRAKNGGVTVRNARLERFSDRTSMDDENYEQLAADSAVTPAVEALLGLSFDHFCQTVVLPQGAFSEFLRAQGAERREMLLKLLGAGLYDQMRTAANQRAALADERIKLLNQQLTRLGPAGDDEIDAAAARVTALNDLGARLTGLLDDIADAGALVEAGRRRIVEIDSGLATLAALQAPDGLDDLARARIEADSRHIAAQREEQRALAADRATREQLAGAPARAPLEQWARAHAEQDRIAFELPDARDEVELATAASTAAREARVDAAAVLESARSERDDARAAAEAAAAAHQTLEQEMRLLTAIRTPDSVAEHASVLADAANAAAEAEKALRRAEDDEAASVAAIEEAPARGPLEQAVRDFDALASALVERAAAAQQSAVSETAWRTAQSALEEARARRDGARSDRESVQSAHSALALRPHLMVGERCPVCDQPVEHLPAAGEMPELSAADETLAAAEAQLGRRVEMERDAATAVATAGSLLAEMERRIDALTGQLAAGPEDAATARALLVRRERAENAGAAAGAAVRSARTTDRAARAAFESARAQGATLRAAFSAARDQLVVLGAPDVGDDLAENWHALQTWAQGAAAERADRLPIARTVADGARNAAALAQAGLDRTQSEADRCLTVENGAAAELAAARTTLSGLERRLADLSATLGEAPDAAAVATALASLDAMEVAAQRSGDALRAAREERDSASAAVAEQVRAGEAAWLVLRSARDRLVHWGAPALAGDSVADGWQTLVAWAGARVGELTVDHDRAVTEMRSAEAALVSQEAALREAFRVVDVYLPEAPPARAAPGAHAAALARATSEHDRLLALRAEHQRLTTERSTATEDQQVAATLGLLLRTNRFPEWLERSVLDGLVVDASANLGELSSGQFSLTHQNGEFFVIDHADADSERSVRTLSGGETFQASLALALALSSQLSSLAAAGAAKLDSIFLDEGFGTLDQDSLEVVAGTLENLAKGERMVGIITHVAALADRIPVRFVVRRDDRSSHVERESL